MGGGEEDGRRVKVIGVFQAWSPGLVVDLSYNLVTRADRPGQEGEGVQGEGVQGEGLEGEVILTG